MSTATGLSPGSSSLRKVLSRNSPTIFRALDAAAAQARAGDCDAPGLEAAIRGTIHAGGPFLIEYIEVVDAATLAPINVINRPARICLAARLGTCRLIDNVAVDVPPPAA